MRLLNYIFGFFGVMVAYVYGSESGFSSDVSRQDPEMTQIFEGSRTRRLLSAERSQDVSNPVSSTDSSNVAISAHDHIKAYSIGAESSLSDCIEPEDQECLYLEHSMLQSQEEDIPVVRQRIMMWIYSIYFASRVYRASVKESERSIVMIDSVELVPDSFSSYSDSRNESWSDASTHVFFDGSFTIIPSYHTSFWQDDGWQQLLYWRDSLPHDVQSVQDEFNPDKIYNVSARRPNPLSREDIMRHLEADDERSRAVRLGAAHARAVAQNARYRRHHKKVGCLKCCDCSIQ